MERLKISAEERNSILSEIEKMLSRNMRLNKLKINVAEFEKINEKNIMRPLIIFRTDAYMKMFALVDNCQDEIAWHGLVRRAKEQGVYDIYDIVTFPQIVTASHVDTDDEKYTMWLRERMMDKNFPFNDMKMHGHSHVNMQVFSSATDDAYQESLIKNAGDDDYYIFVILNKRRNMAIYLYDFGQGILFETKDMDVILCDNYGEDIQEWAVREMKNNITTASYTRTNYKKGGKKKNGSK